MLKQAEFGGQTPHYTTSILVHPHIALHGGVVYKYSLPVFCSVITGPVITAVITCNYSRPQPDTCNPVSEIPPPK